MSLPDYVTVLLYALGMLAIGAISKRRTTTQREMFSAGRQSPWWASGLSGFMSMFSAGTFVVWGGIAYEHGIVAILINTCYGAAALLIGYSVAGRWNQLGVATPAEYVRLRFGETGLHFFTWTMLIKRILGVSVSLFALAYLLVTLVPLEAGAPFRDPMTGNFSVNWAIVFFGAIVVIYTAQGGLWAVLLTDVLQFIVLTAVVMMVAVLMINGIDDVDQAVNSAPEGFFEPVAGPYGWFFLAGWITIHFFMIGAEWAFVQRFLAVRSPTEARKSAWLFGIMYLATPTFWLLPPLIYRLVAPGVDKQQAYILAAESVLPPGVIGLMFAALFSATASAVSSQLNVFAGVFTNDFYRPLMNPNADEKTLVRAGRFFTALLGGALVCIAILVPQLGGAEKLIISINSLLVVPLFAPALWGLYSNKIATRDMCLVALTSFALGVGIRFGLANKRLISEGDWLWPVANYASTNLGNLEVFVGVVLPVIMLLGLEARRRTAAPGALQLNAFQANAQANMLREHSAKQLDPFAVRIVKVSLLALGLWIIILGVLASDGQRVIVGTGTVLTLASVVVHIAQRRQGN